MVAVVFGGPSLEGIDLSGRNVTVLPPASLGDLLRVLRELRPDAVGLLDCELPFRALPTWHKEILTALDRGIPVVGAAAVGAHRAAELTPQGMEGVGDIFRRVASGELERDDEVLCDWEVTPEGIRHLSLPLVTMRDALVAARERGLLSGASAGLLTTLAEDLYWRERTWEALLEAGRKAGLSAEELDTFRGWLPQAPDPVRADAEALLLRLEELAAGAKADERTKAPAGPSKAVSSLFKSLDQRDRPVSSATGPLRQRCIGDLVTFAHPEADDLNGRALNRKLSLLLASFWDLSPTEEEIDRERRRLRRRFDLKSDEDLSRWMAENDLDEEEFSRLLGDEALLHRLHRWFMQGRIHAKNTGAILDELKLRGGYVEWKGKAARREALLRENEDLLREERRKAFSTSFMHLVRDHLRAEGIPWHGALVPDVLPETGMEIPDLLDELLASRTTRLLLERTMSAATGARGENTSS